MMELAMCYGCIRCGKCRPKEEPLLKPGTCPVCGHPNPRDVRVCEECGMPVPPPAGTNEYQSACK